MRSHAKASSAGSNQRRATRRGPLLVLATVLATAVVCLSPSFAAAAPMSFEFLDAFGPDGTNTSGFGTASSAAVDQGEGAVYVLDGGADALFKFDLEGNPVDFGGSSPDVSGNELSGLAVGGGPGERQVAVNPKTHTIYLTGGEEEGRARSLLAFKPNGDPALFTAGPGSGTNEITGFYGLRGVAVDSNGSIYVSGVRDYTFTISKDVGVYSASGALIQAKIHNPGNPDESEYIVNPGNIAVDANGALYSNSSPGGSVYRFTPSEYPVTENTTYPPQPELIDPHFPRGLAIDPLTNRLYVVEAFEEGGNPVRRVAVFGEDGTLESSFAGAGEAGELEFPGGIAIANVGEFGGSGDIAKPFVADNPSGGPAQVKMFREELVIAKPSVEASAALNITADSAKLRAKVNPNNRETTYRFEYGLEDCSLPTATCTTVTPPNPDIGAGRKGVFAFAQLVGLQAGTTYHFRVIAENSVDTTVGPDSIFTTQVSALGFQLPDSRAWEMVSPPDKHGGKLILVGSGGASYAVIRAAADGEGLAYQSYGSIEATPEGNMAPEQSQVLARRGGAGWHSKDISPPHTEATGISLGAYTLFTPDLSRALLYGEDDTPLSPQADERTPYLRENTEPAAFTPLLTNKEGFANVPSGASFGDLTIDLSGANPQLDHIVLSSQAQLVAGAQPSTLYMWSEGEVSLISQLPAGEGGTIAGGELGSGAGSVRGAVSDDGSRVFWGLGQYSGAGINLTALYLRDTEAEETVRLDIPQPGASEAGAVAPAFQGASADGTVVYFTDSQQLTADASPAGRDLYRCEIPAGPSASGCATLTDISAPLVGSGESASVKGVISALSEDGTRIYFVAEGKLDTEANAEGDSATLGEPNLYLWEEGAGTRFIATLANGDSANWGGSNGGRYTASLSAAVAPGGRYLTFMSQRSLTGYDNQDAFSGEPNEEVFRYDAANEELDCVSCNPSGASPVGERLVQRYEAEDKAVDRRQLWGKRWVAAILPQTGGKFFTTGAPAENALTYPRAMLDNGRVFFNAVDALVPADSNGQWDVYQYEPLGVGDCSASSGGASITRSGNGCVSLLSSGTADEEAAFLDSSATGDDVFFLTKARLSVLDEDTELDVYDARVNGVPEKLTPRTECLGEACQPVPSPPSDPTPASASFEGAGNEPSARCPKGKKRQLRNNGSSRCVAQKKQHKKKAHKAKRAADKRRAGR